MLLTSYLQIPKMIVPLTVLPISSRHRVAQISYHPTAPYLAIQSHDRSIDVFRIRTAEEVRKKQARRQKRAKEKQAQKKEKSDRTENVDEAAQEVSNQEVALVDLYTPYLVIRASGKIRSFDFVENDSHPKGIQVRMNIAVHLYHSWIAISTIYRFSRRCPVTRQKSILFHHHIKTKKIKKSQKPRAFILLTCMGIGQMCELSA